MALALPNNFSGLAFAPSEENAVYVLLGLLWQFLPVQLAFEFFETDPLDQKSSHTKWLDAKAKLFENGEWKDISVEFKHRSSGFRSDLVRHPGVYADLLICWEHDATDVEPCVGKVLELRKVFWDLPLEERNRIIWKPDIAGKIPNAKKDHSVLISKFSQGSQMKVQTMIDYWESVAPGTSEIKFYAGKRIAMRVYAYKNEYIQVLFPFADKISVLLERYNGKRNKGGISIPFEPLRTDDVLCIAQNVRTVARNS